MLFYIIKKIIRRKFLVGNNYHFSDINISLTTFVFNIQIIFFFFLIFLAKHDKSIFNLIIKILFI